jgi:hypothetical protein
MPVLAPCQNAAWGPRDQVDKPFASWSERMAFRTMMLVTLNQVPKADEEFGGGACLEVRGDEALLLAERPRRSRRA